MEERPPIGYERNSCFSPGDASLALLRSKFTSADPARGSRQPQTLPRTTFNPVMVQQHPFALGEDAEADLIRLVSQRGHQLRRWTWRAFQCSSGGCLLPSKAVNQLDAKRRHPGDPTIPHRRTMQG
jgi:hypothetical protein